MNKKVIAFFVVVNLLFNNLHANDNECGRRITEQYRTADVDNHESEELKQKRAELYDLQMIALDLYEMQQEQNYQLGLVEDRVYNANREVQQTAETSKKAETVEEYNTFSYLDINKIIDDLGLREDANRQLAIIDNTMVYEHKKQQEHAENEQSATQAQQSLPKRIFTAIKSLFSHS